jgi:hypothetical protein
MPLRFDFIISNAAGSWARALLKLLPGVAIVEHYLSQRTILPLPDLSRRSAAQAEGAGRGEGERAQPIDCEYYSRFFSRQILVSLSTPLP